MGRFYLFDIAFVAVWFLDACFGGSFQNALRFACSASADLFFVFETIQIRIRNIFYCRAESLCDFPLGLGEASLNQKHDGFSVPSQSLIWLNVHSDNEAKQEVIDYLLDKNADLILLSEVNDQWIQSMEVLNKRWPYQMLHPQEDNFGMAVFSRFEFDSHARLKLDAFEVPAVEMILRFRDWKTLAVFAVHPVPPIGKNYTQSRDNYLANLSRHLHGQKKPCIVIGDFNATPWHPPVRRLLNQNQLK